MEGFISSLRCACLSQRRQVGGTSPRQQTSTQWRANFTRCRAETTSLVIDDETLVEVAKTAVEEFARPGQVMGIGGGGGLLNRVMDVIDVQYNTGALVDITLVPGTEELARRMVECDLPVGSLSDNPVLDVVFVGAEVVDEDLNYIMPSRCDLLRERMLLEAAATRILVVDESALQGIIPELTTIPVDLIPRLVEGPKPNDKNFSQTYLLRKMCRLPNMPSATTAVIPMGRRADLLLGDGLLSPEFLAKDMSSLPGVEAHGLVSGLVTRAFVAGADMCVFEKTDAVSSTPPDAKILSDEEVVTLMKPLSKWKRVRSGSALERRFKFDGFQRAFAFVENLAALAVKMGHFPEMSVVHSHVTVTLTTHRAGGLTRRDIVVAHLVDRRCDGVKECYFDG